MDKIKQIGGELIDAAIEKIRKWYFINWNDGIFGRGKTIFVSLVLVLILIKFIYSIFA